MVNADRGAVADLMGDYSRKMLQMESDGIEALAFAALNQAGCDVNRVRMIRQTDYATGTTTFRFEVDHQKDAD